MKKQPPLDSDLPGGGFLTFQWMKGEIPSQDQQQAKRCQQLLVRTLPKEEVQDRQEQQVSGV